MWSEEEQKVERKLIREATEEGVRDVLLVLGVDISDPKAVQEMQRDMHWLRKGRQASDNMPKYFRRAGVGALFTLAVYILWAWLSPVISHLWQGK